MRHWRTTRNSNVANQTGSAYISGTMTDRMTIPMANLGFSTTPSSKQLTQGDCDNERQPEMAIRTFWAPILQFLIVDRCRNHLANLMSSSSKIPNFGVWILTLSVIVPKMVIISGFGRHIDMSGFATADIVRVWRPDANFTDVIFLMLRIENDCAEFRQR